MYKQIEEEERVDFKLFFSWIVQSEVLKQIGTVGDEYEGYQFEAN